MVRTSAPLVVLAAGATLVVLCGGIDLSIAALGSLSTVFLALWLPDLGGADHAGGRRGRRRDRRDPGAWPTWCCGSRRSS